MAPWNIIRIVIQVFATICNLIGGGFITAAILSSAWQIMIEPGTGEIHQHGLWMDYIYSNRFHMAGFPAPGLNPGWHEGAFLSGSMSGMEAGAAFTSGTGSGYGYYYGYPMAPGGQWIMTYKFGDAVYGDDVHRAQPYQIYALILLCLALVLATVGILISYCSSVRPALGITWAALLFLAVILGAAGLIQFYVATMLPEYRFVYTDRRVMLFVGYSYWWAVAGMVGIGIAMILSIAMSVLQFLNGKRRDEVVVRYAAPPPPASTLVYRQHSVNGKQTRI